MTPAAFATQALASLGMHPGDERWFLRSEPIDLTFRITITPDHPDTQTSVRAEVHLPETRAYTFLELHILLTAQIADMPELKEYFDAT
jgi:hypothetical protein